MNVRRISNNLKSNIYMIINVWLLAGMTIYQLISWIDPEHNNTKGYLLIHIYSSKFFQTVANCNHFIRGLEKYMCITFRYARKTFASKWFISIVSFDYATLYYFDRVSKIID